MFDAADIWGLNDPGRLAPDKAADVIVFDAEHIDRGEERPVFDMPGSGMPHVRSAKASRRSS